MVAGIDSTQHCLTIAAAFIAIIAACATLINSANTKAESLAKRIRDAACEHRERKERKEPKDAKRCRQLQEEIERFQGRYRWVQRAQRLLFSTIAIFISSLAVFVLLALYIVYFHLPEDTVTSISHLPIKVVGIGVLVGTSLMLAAISLHFLEIGRSYETLCIETRDCQLTDGTDSPAPVVLSPGTPEMSGSVG